MNRAPKLDWLFCGWLCAISAGLVACAMPQRPVTNAIRDDAVRNCSGDLLAGLSALDVAIVIDTSQSTGLASGFDIDGDGDGDEYAKGNRVRESWRFAYGIESDRGDSRLAAQIAAIRPLVRNSVGLDIRFSLIAFSGSSIPRTDSQTQYSGSRRDSRVLASLTRDTRQLNSVLDAVLEAGSDGRTVFSAGMARATRSLLATSRRQPRQNRHRRKLALFLSDARAPNQQDAGGDFEDVDPRMKVAAVSARNHQVIFHTFGLSPDAADWRRHPLGQIAGATGGRYHAIEDPRNFYCHLVSSLVPTVPERDWRNAFAQIRKNSASTLANDPTGHPTGANGARPR